MKDGGPAFPTIRELISANETFNVVSTEGMTLRDWFAGQALAGMMASPAMSDPATLLHAGVDSGDTETMLRLASSAAFGLADAMLKARGES